MPDSPNNYELLVAQNLSLMTSVSENGLGRLLINLPENKRDLKVLLCIDATSGKFLYFRDFSKSTSKQKDIEFKGTNLSLVLGIGNIIDPFIFSKQIAPWDERFPLSQEMITFFNDIFSRYIELRNKYNYY